MSYCLSVFYSRYTPLCIGVFLMLESQKKNSKGIFLMLISMASFAVGDTFVKISGAFLSPSQIMFFLISGGLIIFTFIA